MSSKPYWIGKCEHCVYSASFSLAFGTTWECQKDRSHLGWSKNMRDIKTCDGPYRPKEATEDFTLTFTDMPPAIAKECEDIRLSADWGDSFYPGFFHLKPTEQGQWK